jgi:hypothetical protein
LFIEKIFIKNNKMLGVGRKPPYNTLYLTIRIILWNRRNQVGNSLTIWMG